MSELIDDLLQQLGKLLQEDELFSLLKGLQMIIRSGDGFGELQVVIEDGHIKYIKPTISLKPSKIRSTQLLNTQRKNGEPPKILPKAPETHS